MRTQRTMAVLAAIGAFLLATVGVLLTPGAASAAPDYPPPPSSISVSSGTVRAGASVGVMGVGFGAKEPVVVQTRYRPKAGFWFPKHGIVIGQKTVWTDKKGEFSTRVATYFPGKVIIVAHGLESGETGSATVNVVPRYTSADGYGSWYNMGLPGMQAVHNTVGRWLGVSNVPVRGAQWRAW